MVKCCVEEIVRKKQRKEEKILEEVGVVVGDSGKFWFLKRIRYLGRRKMVNLSCPWKESSCTAAAPAITRRRHLVSESEDRDSN